MHFADRNDVALLPGDPPFNARVDAVMANAELRICRRAGQQAKSMARLVLLGRLRASYASELASALGVSRLNLEPVGFDPLTDVGSADVKIVAFVSATKARAKAGRILQW